MVLGTDSLLRRSSQTDRPVRVAIAGDIRLHRDTLAEALAREPGLLVVEVAPADPSACEALAASGPDVVVVDSSHGGSLVAVEEVSSWAPSARIVVLAVPESEPAVLGLVEAGASALIPADASQAEVIEAVKGAGQGESFCPPRVTAALLDRLRRLTHERQITGTCLTSREVEVTRLIDEGFSNKEIAARLSIAVPTVKNHVHNILEKLGVGRRSEAAAKVWGRSS